MKYQIHLDRMEFRAYHGCYDLEQVVGNRFAVDIVITTEMGSLAESDDVTQSVNYLTVYELVSEQMKIKSRTIEVVAVRIIDRIKGEFSAVESVRCEVTKIAPPLGGKVAGVSVIVEF